MRKPQPETIVHNRSGIAAAIAEVWGWLPSDTQVSKWTRRHGLPVEYHATHLCADEAKVKAWAERNKDGLGRPLR